MISYLSKYSGIEKVGLLIGFFLVENNIAMLPHVGSLYYVFMFVALLFLLNKGRISHGSITMLGLYLACLASIWLNDIPAFFQPFPRFISFLLITLLVSPAIINEAFTRFRSQVFVTIIKLLPYVIVASVLYGLVGRGYDKNYFQGVTNHSMLLGPFAALCTLYCVYRLLQDWDQKKTKRNYGILLLLSLYCLLQAASRTAFSGTILAVVVFLAVYYRNKLGRFFRIVIVGSVVLVTTFPLWSRYMDLMEQKNRGNITELDVDTREELWEQRMVEFKSSPFWGIGFSSVSTNALTGSTFADDGKVETGSSWLSILSMTGIFGFIAFFGVYLSALKRAWKLCRSTPLLSGFLLSVLCFWTIHMVAEGYIYAGGSPLFFCVWLVFGVICGVSNNKKLAYELQQKLAGGENKNS